MSQMLISITLSCDGERSLVAKLVMSHCREKLLALIILYPYRKPTQVVEAKSLRCASETTSRNSANWPRNLGRRGAQGVHSPKGFNKEAAATVYQKHSSLLNRKMMYRG